MTDRVHTGVQADQATVGEPPVDRVAADPEREELPAGDNPVLTGGERGDLRVDGG